MRIYVNPCFTRFSFDKNDNKTKMTKNERTNYNQSCDSSNGSASIEEQKLNSINADHENFAMDDAYNIDKSLTMEYRVHADRNSEKRRRQILVSVVVILAVILVIGVIAFICIYVKKEKNLTDTNNKLKADKRIDCNEEEEFEGQSTPGICNTKKCKSIASELKKTMNLSADPCHNFYEFTCGNWARLHPLPASMPKLDTMALLNLKKMDYLKNVIEREGKRTAFSKRKVPKGFKRKILTYYESCMDTDVIDRKDSGPLLQLIDRFGRWSPISSWEDQKSVVNVTELLLRTHRYFTPSVFDDMIRSPLFKSIVKVNDKNSSQHIVEFNLPDFPLTDPGDFISKSERSKKIREKYKLLKTNYVALLGPNPDAKSILRKMWKFEVLLANISIQESMHRNVNQEYHLISIEKFQSLVGNEIDWLYYIKGTFRSVRINVSPKMKIGVRSLTFYKALNNLIKQTDKSIVKDYIIWVCVWKFGPYVSAPYREANHNFQRALIGIQERTKRWKTCIEDIEQTMDFGLTSLYVKKTLTKGDKITVSQIVKNVTRQFKNNLVNVEWMDVTTKASAFAKVDSIADNIGYPEFVKNETYLNEMYSSVKIYPNKYFQNILSMYENKRLKNLAMLRKKVDRAAFELPPTLVEAYFDVNKNKMVFLAGILRSPFYDMQRPMALNYGALGLVAGHEVTHAFDDLGRRFDAKGNKEDWWSNSSEKQFRKRSTCMRYQYGNYTITFKNQSINLNGINTLGENIADNGGIKVAYMGYKEWERTHGKEKLLPGISLTMDQLFFVSHGQVWCGVYRDEYLKLSINTDYHSPSKFRIIGPLSNLKHFSDAFKCKLGTPMNPVKKCLVW